MSRVDINKYGISKVDVLTYVLAAIALIGMLAFGFYSRNKLLNNAIHTKGVVTEKRNMLKGNPYIYYIYIVDNKKYKGGQRYSPNLQEINIGDTCYVIYEQDDPGNNTLLKSDKDKRCLKINKPDRK